MKTILTIAILLTSALSMAASSVALTKDATAIYPAKVTLESVEITTPNCPINALCEPMAVANVTIHLAGCAYKVGMVSTNMIKNDEGRIQLNMSAVAIRSKQSSSIKCFVAPTESRRIIVQGGTFAVPDVDLNDLNASQE